MAVDKHVNVEHSAGIPLAIGDRLYGQEYLRDFLFQIDEHSKDIFDRYGKWNPLVQGCALQGANGPLLTISAGVAYAAWDVKIPTGAWADPPSTSTVTIMAKRINFPGVSGFNGWSGP